MFTLVDTAGLEDVDEQDSVVLVQVSGKSLNNFV